MNDHAEELKCDYCLRKCRSRPPAVVTTASYFCTLKITHLANLREPELAKAILLFIIGP